MQTLRKSERLCNFRLKELLFNHGQGFFVYPFRVTYFTIKDPKLEAIFFKSYGSVYEGNTAAQSNWQKQQNPSWPQRQLANNAFFIHPAKLLVSVPRKNFKKAVDRNRIKRLVKESYRKNKSAFYSFLEGRGEFCLLAFIYTAREILPGHEIENKIVITLQKLAGVIASPANENETASSKYTNGSSEVIE
jgi:hypothetical protein